MGLFTRYYQPGRLCVVQYGPDAGKLCFVVDIINQTRVLVDGAGVTGIGAAGNRRSNPSERTLCVFNALSVKRQSMPVRRIALTDQYLKIPRSVRSATLKKALEKDDVIAKFNQSSWGKRRLAKEQRANMSDFDRFKLMVILKQRRKVMQQKLKSLKK
ncbi:ribosomal protein RPL14 [Toxoplasma gondii ME49]|uniref:Ribosomal protein RPL14 n=14 Tax=Toxoplasma gondii TaxID=5811 RepID=A0A125YYW0_TOXGV|nr:ribosomal protein RPL14 [Toxoplasma gondii ME49]EPR57149.1 ribosomal protein RPL14 [Toxoplasma gondii GT1]ESS33471.1 ribosomal protein RPL14 [Toxoplasma gondii VEG]KAF4644098.1 ribosomal protein RPL14 [Toxoplasma gondii]KFG29820.1 ribosomal protein RPL14 [Toxoplasma gondii p89]KFG38837.1 ribosomal protein RPL14 [Toxoplasma gondii GAB2-2007-GAL-DOM2]KFG43048.1 ribosomal protein RPL14 [Toxoplasma gondii FOU]KFG58891.1 ribosomal protein RPL14 [Toxoplasma gondii RUB]KFH01754.1 ribosomal prot|eukprot:XP_018636247.1 ribosomal protein RPL14 [Toxoplasma gondii ME49]